jgi:hypothetical protein
MTTACTYLAPDYDARTSRISPAPYCGCRQMYKDTAYCEEHYPVVYQEGTAQRKRHKDIRSAVYVQDISSLFNDLIVELEQEGEIDL